MLIFCLKILYKRLLKPGITPGLIIAQKHQSLKIQDADIFKQQSFCEV